MEPNSILGFSDSLVNFFVSNEKSKLIEFIGLTKITRLKKDEVFRFLGEEEGQKSLRVVDLFSTAVLKARTESQESSLIYFEMGETELDRLHGNAYLFSRLFYSAGWSFYHYLNDVYHKAAALTIEGLALSEYLESQGGNFLGLRRMLDQVPNLAKIWIKEGSAVQGYGLYNAILRALIHGDFTSLPGKWDAKQFADDEFNRQRGIDDVILNAARLILGYAKREEEKTLFEILLNGIGDFELTNDHAEIIGKYISLKRHYFQGDHSIFLSELTRFLMLPMDTYFDLLKLSLIGNYLALAQSRNRADFPEICAKAHDYVSGHLHLQLSEQFLIPVLYKEFPMLNQENHPVYI